MILLFITIIGIYVKLIFGNLYAIIKKELAFLIVKLYIFYIQIL